MTRTLGIALGAMIGLAVTQTCAAGVLGIVPNPTTPNTPTVMVCTHEAPVPFICIAWLRGTWAVRQGV